MKFYLLHLSCDDFLWSVHANLYCFERIRELLS
jgi:hypothetical protein